MFLSASELTLGEAYIYDDFDIEGDIEAAFDLADYLLAQERSVGRVLISTSGCRNCRRAITREQGTTPLSCREKVHATVSRPAGHQLSLRSSCRVLCAVAGSAHGLLLCLLQQADEDLDSAQERKLDYICRKLRLRPGERLLDIGCGWGGLIMHAAAHYGVECVGITLSVPQAELARERLREAGLNDRCRVEVSDYRDIDHDQQYDKIVSVGMFEHVGEALLPEYFHRAWELLRPGGVFLNHGIAQSATYHRRGPSFTDRYVFPDGDLVPISTSLRAAELTGFEVRDVESLREHYALTLHHWVRRLESHATEARRITSDTTYRIWRLYMAGSAHAFRSGRLNVYQTLLSKPSLGRSGLPLTRDDWYRTQT